jgi:hypothetical protein
MSYMSKKFMTVQIFKKNGEYYSTFNQVVRLCKTLSGKFLIVQELDDAQMKLLGKDPDNEENDLVHTYDSEEFFLIVL